MGGVMGGDVMWGGHPVGKSHREPSERHDSLANAFVEEDRRHARETVAILIAGQITGFAATDRALIRRRVQELLGCNDPS